MAATRVLTTSDDFTCPDTLTPRMPGYLPFRIHRSDWHRLRCRDNVTARIAARRIHASADKAVHRREEAIPKAKVRFGKALDLGEAGSQPEC